MGSPVALRQLKLYHEASACSGPATECMPPAASLPSGLCPIRGYPPGASGSPRASDPGNCWAWVWDSTRSERCRGGQEGDWVGQQRQQLQLQQLQEVQEGQGILTGGQPGRLIQLNMDPFIFFQYVNEEM